MDPPVTVLVPTHRHDETLAYSVRSVLDQTFVDLRVIIIGDGPTPQVRDVAYELCRSDERVSFQVHPKSSRHAEPIRDQIIRAVNSSFIAYNGDDDLWLPQHLETLINALGDHCFVHPLSIQIGADDLPFFIPSDLQRPESVAWHLNPPHRNSISLSGVLHTRDAYLRLPFGWRETPAGRWTDHYMWQQFFEEPWFSGITSAEATVLKLTTQGRESRSSEITRWWERMHSPGFAAEWNGMVSDAIRRAAVVHNVESSARKDEINLMSSQLEEMRHAFMELQDTEAKHRNEIRELSSQLEEMRHAFAELQRTDVERQRRLKQLRQRIDATEATISWRITRPLRAIRRLQRRRR